MNTITFPSFKTLFTQLISLSRWVDVTHPCILFFGEYEYPKKEDYQD